MTAPPIKQSEWELLDWRGIIALSRDGRFARTRCLQAIGCNGCDAKWRRLKREGWSLRRVIVQAPEVEDE